MTVDNDLGVALSRKGAHREALEVLREAILRQPDDALAYYNLGNAHAALGNRADAVSAFEQSVKLWPDFAFAWFNLGRALAVLEQLEGAAAAYRRAAMTAPALMQAWLSLAQCEARLGRQESARSAYENAVELAPTNVTALCGLGASALGMDDPAAAARAYRQALAADGSCACACAGLGKVLRACGQYRAALHYAERALEVDPGLAEAHDVRAAILLDLGRAEEALRAFQRVYEISGSFAARSCVAFVSNYVEGVSSRELPIGAPAAAPSRPRAPRSAARLRIGFVSPDLRRHSVGYFMLPILEHLDRARFDAFCYYTGSVQDDMCGRFRSLAQDWIASVQMSDAELARRIEADGVDLLIDLSGHAAGNRLGVFLRQPAPVQATYLGYPTTTGLASIDYRITDGIVDPAPADGRSSERPVRLPGSYFCYAGPGLSHSQRLDPPVRSNGFVTFGAFNNLAKASPVAMARWARVVNAVPGSKLMLKSKVFVDGFAAGDMVSRMEAAGLPRERVILTAWHETLNDHLSAHDRIDIALDSSPYTGATTTCEALWMGVPVVTVAGDTHASRMGKSILHAAGVGTWACDTDQEYVRCAEQLAHDLTGLAALRRSLRNRLEGSPLMDGVRFTRGFEDALERMVEGSG